MFSTAKPSKTIEPSKKPVSYDEIKNMIEAHFTYLMRHKRFIAQIEKDIIKEEEAKEYLEDVIGITLDNYALSIKDCLSAIKDKLDSTLQLFAELSLFNKSEEKEMAIIQQYILLEYSLVNSHFCHYGKLHKKSLIDNTVQETFNEYSQIHQLSIALKKQLPQNFSAVRKGIEIKVHEKQHQYSHSMRIEKISQLCELNYSLGNFISDYAEALLDVTTDWKNIPILKQLQKDFLEGSEAYQKMSRSTNNVEAIKMAAFELREKIPALAKALPILNDIQHTFNQKKLLTEAHRTIWPSLDNKISRLESKFQFINEQIDTLTSDANIDLTSNFLKNIREKSAKIQDEIAIMRNVWKEYSTPRFQNIDTFNEIINEFHKLKKSLSLKIDSLLDSTHEHLSSLSTAQIEPSQENSTSGTLRANVKNYRQEQLEKIKTYKEDIQKKREAKKTIKSLATKPLTPISLTPPSPPSTDEFHPAMEELLSGLNSNQLDLLVRILSLDKTVKYMDIYHLITNHLDGDISEIGNGSSHKRIRLNSIFVEINTHNNTDLEPSNSTPKKVTGGFFKQHGKSHNSGKMSRFNLELVAETFKKAGITLEVIEELRARLNTGKSL